MDADDERIMRGEEPTDPEDSENAITDLPDNFTQWMEDNQERIAGAKSIPYFLQDNERLIEGKTSIVAVEDTANERRTQLTSRLDSLLEAKKSGLLPKNVSNTLMYIDERISADELADAEMCISRLEAAARRHANRTKEQINDIQFRWDKRWLWRNVQQFPSDLRDKAIRAIAESSPMAVANAMRDIEKNISHSVIDYASDYAKRSPVIRSMLDRLYNDPALAQGLPRIAHINEIKRKCSIITRLDLREATEGLKFSNTEWNWSMGGQTRTTKKGKNVKVEKVYSDLIVYKDKNGKTYSYPVGSTMDSIEFKASKVSEMLGKLPNYIQDAYDGFVFAGRRHPMDAFFEIEYNKPGFVGGAYSGRRTTIHAKGSLDWLKHTLCHEAGHNMDNKVRYSLNKETRWNSAVRKDGGYPTKYAKKSIKEDIAESMAGYVEDRTEFKKKFPNRAKLIGELISMNYKRR